MLIILVLLTAGHFFISYQIRHLLPKLVSQLSEGEYTLTYKTIDFRYVHPGLLVTGIEVNPQSESLETAYSITIDSIYLGVESYFPLFLKNRQINVDLLELVHPKIIGKRLKYPASTSYNTDLHKQVERLQQNAMQFLHVLQVDECNLIKGRFQYYPFPNRPEHFNLTNINLSINDLVIPSLEYRDKKMITAAIRLELMDPKLKIPDSNIVIQVNKFIWDNQEHYVDIDAFTIAQRQTARRDSFQIHLDTIRIRKIDWPLWLDSGIVRLDTILAKNGNLYFASQPSTRKNKKDSLGIIKMKFWDAIGDLDIHHFSARHINTSILSRLPKQEKDYALLGDTMVINDLSIRPDRETPIVLKDLAIAVREFTDKGSGNKFRTSFSKFQLRQNTILLNDYRISSTRQSKLGLGSSLLIPRLYLKGLSLQDLFDKRANVGEIVMESPLLTLNNLSKRSGKRFSGLEEVRPYVDVDRLLIKNASLLIRQDKTNIHATGVAADILAHELLNARSEEAFLASLSNVNIANLDLDFPLHQFNFHHGSVDYRNRSLRFSKVKADVINGSIKADLSNVAIDAIPELKPLESGQVWQFKTVDIGSGKIAVMPEQKIEGKTSSIALGINQMQLGNIDFTFSDYKTTINALFIGVTTTDVKLDQGRLSWGLAEASGRKLNFQLPGVNISSRQFELNSNGQSTLDSAEVRIVKPGISAHILAQQIISNEAFQSYDPDTLVFDRIVMVRPQVMASVLNSLTDGKDDRTFLIGTKVFEMVDPVFRISIAGTTEPAHFQTTGSLVSGKEFYWDQVSGKPNFTLQSLYTDLDSFNLISGGKEIFKSGSIQTSFENIQFDPAKQTPLVLDINRFSVEAVDLSRFKKGDTIQLHTQGIDIRSMKRLYLNKDSLLREAFKLPPIRIYPGNFMYRTRQAAFDIYRMDVSTLDKTLSWDSLIVFNRIPKEDFFKTNLFEKDYFTVKTGKLKAFDLRPIVKFNDTIAFAQKINIDSLYLKIERDKRVKDDTITYRPLLAGMLEKLNVPVIIDSLQLKNATIWHNVIDDKTNKEGTIFFTSVNAQVANLKNIDISDRDSITFFADSKLMGRGDMQLRYRQSYIKPLQSFVLGIQMQSLELPELNRLIIPLHNVQLEKGKINQMNLDVQGNDSLVYGRVKMNYSDLKVSLINKENERRSLLSILANIFVRGKNHRSNPILTERLKDKSVFNYWSKISLNGLLTSIGVRKDGKKTRQFFRQLEKKSRVENLFN